MTEPEQIRLKRKYVVGTTNGRYKSGHNMNGPARKKKQGKPDPPNNTIMVLLPNGKKRFMKKEEEK